MSCQDPASIEYYFGQVWGLLSNGHLSFFRCACCGAPPNVTSRFAWFVLLLARFRKSCAEVGKGVVLAEAKLSSV